MEKPREEDKRNEIGVSSRMSFRGAEREWEGGGVSALAREVNPNERTSFDRRGDNNVHVSLRANKRTLDEVVEEEEEDENEGTKAIQQVNRGEKHYETISVQTLVSPTNRPLSLDPRSLTVRENLKIINFVAASFFLSLYATAG
ncbi:hypothetical protein Trydic_g8680 [Trypoxylus dichotomus]